MKYIQEYEQRYSVTEQGEVWSHLTNKWLKKLLTPYGYHSVTLYKKGSSKRYPLLVHRLVASAYIENSENKLEVNHINFITTDNNISNLEWVTSLENKHHTINHGRSNDLTRFKKGIDHIWKNKIHPTSKSVVEEISGKVFNSVREAARDFNIPHQYVFNCIKRSGTTHGLKFRNKDMR